MSPDLERANRQMRIAGWFAALGFALAALLDPRDHGDVWRAARDATTAVGLLAWTGAIPSGGDVGASSCRSPRCSLRARSPA